MIRGVKLWGTEGRWQENEKINNLDSKRSAYQGLCFME